MADRTAVDWKNGRAENEPSAHYALYTINKEKIREEASGEDCQEWETTGLQMMCSSLPSPLENSLRLFLFRRLKKGAIYTNTGAFSGMEFSLGGGSPAVCYYVLLPDDALVCLLANAEANLEVFRAELAHFCEQLGTRDQVSTLHDTLNCWYSKCVLYVGHVIEALGTHIASLLQLVQQNGGIRVELGVPPAVEADVRQFLFACSVAECLVGAPPGADAILIGVIPGTLALQGVEANSYCADWAKLLLDMGATAEPWRLRKLLEAFKLKTIKDMNILKRLLKQAETDHYFLYRAYWFLWQSGNSDVLLRQAALEGSSSSDVLCVLEEHLTSCSTSPTPVATHV